MILSNSQFEPTLPYWQDYLPYLNQLAGRDFPSCAKLNAMLPGGLTSGGGQTIRFVASDQLADDAYEHRIFTTGQISTRPDSWHDLFNALVWMRYPCIKTAMNQLHYHAGSGFKSGSRGQLRDALTLFDECGVIVFSNKLEILEALAERRWGDAFLNDAFPSSVALSVCGHAILEKYLSPYKAMTAKAVLLHVNDSFMNLPGQDMLNRLDREVAKQMLDSQILSKPVRLTPLPLAGVPGWWPQDEQNETRFYNDHHVFRAAPADLIPAQVLSFDGLSNG